MKEVDILIGMGVPLKFHDKKTVFDDSKCVGEGHTALCITSKIPSTTDVRGTKQGIFRYL